MDLGWSCCRGSKNFSASSRGVFVYACKFVCDYKAYQTSKNKNPCGSGSMGFAASPSLSLSLVPLGVVAGSV